MIIETDDFSFEALKNSSVSLGGGAGIQSAGAVADRGVKAVITGNCGPKAHQALSAAGVKVFTGCSGRIKDAVNDYLDGKLATTPQANVQAHYGSGGGGLGQGRGMGGGRRRG